MKVCVIGAGPAGLTTLKQLRDEEHDVVCFERSSDIGGIWFRHAGDEHEMKVYDDMLLTISMRLMCFSDFMVKGRRFATRVGYLDYLRRYAEHYQLRPSIQFNTAVEQVRKTDTGWLVSVSVDGARKDYTFDAVAVCSGPFSKPAIDVPHLEKFTGTIMHSSRYRNSEPFRGKRVLIVGLAESGADVVRQISEVAAECALSIRSRAVLIPRLFSGKYATDSVTTRSVHHEVFVRATDVPFTMAALFQNQTVTREAFIQAARLSGLALLAANAVAKAPGASADQEQPAESVNGLGQPMWPLKLDVDTEDNDVHCAFIDEWNRKSHFDRGNFSQKAIACKNVSFVPAIVNGKLVVHDGSIEAVEGQTVWLSDGTVQTFDAIVLCTGFERDFAPLEPGFVPDNNVRNLYKHAFHPVHGDRVALIGHVRPYTGGIPICAEMQARYFALLCSNKLQLPSDVNERIAADKAWEEAWTELSPRHTEAVPSQLMFCDSLAEEIGCLPTAAELFEDPALFASVWYYTFNQSSYRLRGPHSDPEAARADLMDEELPGACINTLAFLIAATTWPSDVHPKDIDVAHFPQIMPPEQKAIVTAALAQAATLSIRANQQL